MPTGTPRSRCSRADGTHPVPTGDHGFDRGRSGRGAPGRRRRRAGRRVGGHPGCDVIGGGGPMTPVVELTGISREFPGTPPVQAISNVDLRIEPGEYLSIIGPSGLRQIHPAAPAGVAGPADRRELSAGRGRRRRPDRIPALRAARRPDRVRVPGLPPDAQAVGAGQRHAVDAVPGRSARRPSGPGRGDRSSRSGWPTRMDFLPPLLSGGERQRVAIARALAGSPVAAAGGRADRKPGSGQRESG